MIQRIVLPKTAADLLNPARQTDLKRAAQLLNAFQNMRLVVRSSGGVSSNVIQVSGNRAILTAEADTLELDSETKIWIRRAREAGGTFRSNSIAIANGLILAIKNTTFNSKIVYLLPLLGGNLATARVPLRDSLGVGIATNNGFTDSAFSQSMGLQGDGTGYLDTLISYNSAGTSNNAGLLFWESNNASAAAGAVEPMGANNSPQTARYCLDLRNSGSIRQSFQWGTPGNEAILAAPPQNGDYYGQRSSANSRSIYRSGALLATNTTSDTASVLPTTSIQVMNAGNVGGGVGPTLGRCAVAAITNGLLTGPEVAQLHQILTSNLIIPTERPS